MSLFRLFPIVRTALCIGSSFSMNLASLIKQLLVVLVPLVRLIPADSKGLDGGRPLSVLLEEEDVLSDSCMSSICVGWAESWLLSKLYDQLVCSSVRCRSL